MSAASYKPSEESHYDAQEPVRGLPARLPAGETMLWQGAPDWRAMAIRVFHVRKLAIYFAALLAWDVVSTLADGDALADQAASLAQLAGLGAFAVGILCLLSWGISRTTVYTITSKRVVIRAGIAVPKTINLPYVRLASAGMRPYAGGTGDILLTPLPDDKIAYLLLWPHCQAWKFSHARPILRVVPDAAGVAAILGGAMQAETGEMPLVARTRVRMPGRVVATA
jgi:hypothetical protein